MLTRSIKCVTLLLSVSISFRWTNIWHVNADSIEVNGNGNEKTGLNKKPNILVILADDVGTGDVPGYWNTGKINMPHLQDLITKGTVFTDAHATPVCAPSRYMLLSGNYPHRGTSPTGVWEANYKASQFCCGQKSIADVLREGANYHTGIMGKWHIGAKIPTKDGFENPNFLNMRRILRNPRHDWSVPLMEGPQDLGFDSSYITLGGIQNPPYIFFRDGKLDIQDLSNITVWERGQYTMREGLSWVLRPGEGSLDWDSTAYNMILVNETTRFLDDHMDSRPNDPFFAHVSLGAVHQPHSPPKNYLDGSPVSGQQPTPHMDLLDEMDKVVGSIIQSLDERSLLNDTIVVFTSDNGGQNLPETEASGHLSSGPLRGKKGYIYEGGHRIPLIMRWDGGSIPKGKRYPHLLGLNDLFATLCNLAGIDVPKGQAIDSISFADSFVNDMGPREFLYINRAGKNANLTAKSIRKDNFKLILHSGDRPMELFDLDRDISENSNIISNEDHSKLVEVMLEELQFIDKCYDTKKSFHVSKLGKHRTCAFFQEDTEKRCDKFVEARQECPVTCRRKDIESSYCRSIQFDQCYDSKIYFHVKRLDTTVSCRFFQQWTQSRCKKFVEGRIKCPVTCKSTCPTLS